MNPFRFHRIASCSSALIAVFLLSAPVSRAAGPTKIFVASYGNDANDGGRGTPKRTFKAAESAVADGGEIVVLDTAGYGSFSIDKSLALTVPTGVNAFITVVGDNDGIDINIAASAVVTLRGLIIEGSGGAGSGIAITAGGTVRVENSTVRQFHTGISLQAYGKPCLLVDGSSVSDVYDGVYVNAYDGNYSEDVVLTDCKIDNASDTAIVAFSNVSAATSKLTLSRCVLTHGYYGVYGYGSGTKVNVDSCIVNGVTYGVYSTGGARLVTRDNNTFTNNTNDGVFGSHLTAQ